MPHPRTFLFALLPTLLLPATSAAVAQDPAAPAVAPSLALPAARSAEATALFDQAVDKMAAYGRGTFATTESQDSAMLRGAGLPFGQDDVEVDGGWHRELVWGDHDGSTFVRCRGRLLAKVQGQWKLRGSRLAGGRPAPFTLDPDLLFTVLKAIPESARVVEHVEAGELGGKPVVILSLVLEGDPAVDVATSGALPAGGAGGAGGLVFLAGPGGLELPESQYAVHLALFVDQASGDLVRFAAKVFEKSAMMGRVQIQVGGAGGDDEPADEPEPPAAGAAPVWKRGFRQQPPAKDESVTTFRADFRQLGRAEPPVLDDAAKRLLRLQ